MNDRYLLGLGRDISGNFEMTHIRAYYDIFSLAHPLIDGLYPSRDDGQVLTPFFREETFNWGMGAKLGWFPYEVGLADDEILR